MVWRILQIQFLISFLAVGSWAGHLELTPAFRKVLRKLPDTCAQEVVSQFRDALNTSNDSEVIDRLKHVNTELKMVSSVLQDVDMASLEGSKNIWQLAQQLGYLKLGKQRVEKTIVQTKKDGTTENITQRIPYYEVLLPYAKTGMYFPNGDSPDKLTNKIDAILVIMPGIGTDFSIAKSVIGLAGTFNKVLKGAKDVNVAIPQVNGRPLSVLSLPMDAPLNGMAEEAPFIFGHPELIVQILEHTQMLLNWLFPGKPIFFAGRSQGGANVLELATRSRNVAGVIALNPSLPLVDVISHVIQSHMDPENSVLKSVNARIHPRSWAGHNVFTGSYSFLEKPSHAPAMVMVSRNDGSYPQELYRPAIEQYVSNQMHNRRLVPFDDVIHTKAHDLWNPENRMVYDQIVSIIGDYIIKNGAVSGR